jgi:hypothetical protein
MFSCRPARHLPDGEYLLDRYSIEAPSNNIDKDELRTYVRQKPNKRILGLRFHLWLHNIASQDKDSWLHNWLRRIGEEPVMYDSFVTRRSSGQIEQYLRNKGYYEAEVEDAVQLRRKRARVRYLVEPGEPYHIAAVGYTFDDQGLQEIVLADSSNSLIRPGIIFDVDILQEERVRIENYLKNNGYFNFSREHVYFNADTTLGNMSVDITIGISMFRKREEDGQVALVSHQRYSIGNIYIYPEFDPRASIDRPDDYYMDFDTLVFRGMHYLYRNRIPVNHRVIAQSNFILPGNLYSKENVDRTYRNFFELRQYRLVNIRFDESSGTYDEALDQTSVPFDSVAPDHPGTNNPSTANHTLDARIQLTPFSMQSYTVEFEGTNYNLEASFRDHMVTETNYSLIFNNQDIRIFAGTWRQEILSIFRLNAIRNSRQYSAAISNQAERPKRDGHYRLFGTEFAQYVKSDIDHQVLPYLFRRRLYGIQVFCVGAGFALRKFHSSSF